MKYYYIICLCLIYPFSLFSQVYDFSGMHGLKGRNGMLAFELGGYNIRVSEEKGGINDEKTLKSIKKKYKIQDIIAEYDDDLLDVNLNHKIIECALTTSDKPDIKGRQYCYLLKTSESKVTVVCFYTFNPRDRRLERAVARECLANRLINYVDNRDASSILFAGREVKLGDKCKWTSPHTISCMGGEISWSEFSSYEKALQDNDFRILADANSKNAIILLEEEIEVLFEGVLTMAYRVAYAQNFSDPLIKYYVTDEIRGHYISCVLTHQGYNRYDYNLPFLLQEFMSIPELPQGEYNRFDKPELEVLTKGQKKEFVDQDFIFEIRAGTWIPLGPLSSKFDISPSIGLLGGFPITNNLALDLYFQFAIPVNKQPFEYYYSRNDYEMTQTNLIGNLGLRIRRQQTISDHIYLNTYTGFGLNALSTDLEKENPGDDENPLHSVATIDLLGGISIRYKKVGCYIEYHYSPYSLSNKVHGTFGTNALHVGINIVF